MIVQRNVIEGLSEEEKTSIREQTQLIKPFYDKIDNLLPIFYALTSNTEAAKRLILMKYMFEEHLQMLGQNKFAFSLEHLARLKEQFSGYFSWVRSQAPHLINTGLPAQNAATTAMTPAPLQNLDEAGVKRPSIDLKLPANKKQKVNQSPALLNAGTPQQQARNGSPIQQNRSQEGNNFHVPSPIPNAGTPIPINDTIQPSSPQQQLYLQQQQKQPQLQHAQMQNQVVDLTSPQSRPRQLLGLSPQQVQVPQQQGQTPQQIVQQPQTPQLMQTSQQTQMQTPQPQVQSQMQTPQPQMQTPQQLMQTPQQIQALQQMQAAQHGQTPVQGQQATPQQQAQNQMIYQAAIASGLPPAIVSLLPARALQCSWLLQQAAQNRISLTPQQQQQIRAMLNERVEAAKQQLALREQAQPPTQVQPKPSNMIDFTADAIKTEPVETKPVNPIQQATQMMHLLQQQQQPSPLQQPVVQTKLTPTIQSPRPIPTATLRPGMGPDDKVVNAMMYATDVLKDVARILTPTDQQEEPVCELKAVTEGNRSTLLFEPYIIKYDSEDEEELVEEKILLTEQDVYNTWYEVGMDTGVPSLTDIMPGFDWSKEKTCI